MPTMTLEPRRDATAADRHAIGRLRSRVAVLEAIDRERAERLAEAIAELERRVDRLEARIAPDTQETA